MGIVNITPDSFYSHSRVPDADKLRSRICECIDSKADILDFGACSTRPGASYCSAQEEMNRLRLALGIFRDMRIDIPLSVDTFRASVASMAIEEFGADIINDISGGENDTEMFSTAARLKVPYILTHYQGAESNFGHIITDPSESDNSSFRASVIKYFYEKIRLLRLHGVGDIILDPGLGFGKTLTRNHLLLNNLGLLIDTFRLPVLVGVSRKSMIYNPLHISPNEALNGTSILNTLALTQGAAILRVHDIKEAIEAVELCNLK